MLPLERIMASLKLESLNCGEIVAMCAACVSLPLVRYAYEREQAGVCASSARTRVCVAYVSVFAWLQPNNNGPDSVEPRRLISHITEKIAAC